MRRPPGLISLLLPVLVAVSPTGATPNAAGAAPQGIAPDLEIARRAAAPGDLVPVAIVMAEQADVERLLPTARLLPRVERRSFAMAELKGLANATQPRVRAFLAAAEAHGEAADVRPLWIANGIAARVTSAVLDDLLRFDEIRSILWDPPIPAGEAEDVSGDVSGQVDTSEPEDAPNQAGTPEIWWQLTYVHAPEVWALGYRGEGVVVALIDSGTDRNHSDLSSRIWNNAGEIPANSIDDDQNGYIDDTWGWDFEYSDNNPMPDAQAHGTNCAGIIAGDGTGGLATGVAPAALLMTLKVNTWTQNIAAIQYAIANGADVISMSRSQKWRFNPKPDYDWWRANTDNELLAGIFHANSIGNEGDNQGTDPIPFNIAAPGGSPSPWRHPDQVQAGVSGIVGCGAVDQFNVIAPYSSIGPSTWEDIRAHWPAYPFAMRPEYQDYPWWGGLPGLIKPDLVAPGPDTRTTEWGGGYVGFSGTSAATPHVAGAMALCLEANPSLTLEQMAMILMTTAGDLGAAGKDNVFGAGKLNCYDAVEAALALAFGTVAGTVFDAATELPIAGVLVEATGESESAITDAIGHYQLALPPASYDVAASKFGYEPRTLPVAVTAGQTALLDFALTPAIVAADLEIDPAWQARVAGDNATDGVWLRGDPVGTAAQPEDDHTADPGVLCFMTGKGNPGDPIDAGDVDGGTTTLRTGPIDLSGSTAARVSYWRWYSNDLGPATDDEWVVQISSDGGSTWVDLERTAVAAATWTYREFAVAGYVGHTSQVKVQFIAADLGAASVVEAAVDDFQVFGDPATTAVENGDANLLNIPPRLVLAPNRPNPFHTATAIGLTIHEDVLATLEIYDVGGRLVRSLVRRPMAAGEHTVEWNGRDERGHAAPAGIYICRLTAGGMTVTRRMVMLK